MPKILIAEDEEDIRDLIHFNLFKEKYETVVCADGEEALREIRKGKPDLCLLDVMMPQIDGIQVCEAIRASEEFSDVGIIMLTAKGSEADVLKGLEAGADDYVTKPFSPKELIARVKSVLRRTNKPSVRNIGDEFNIANIKIIPGKRSVSVDGNEINLTYIEFQLLFLLCKKPGWVYTRSQIIDSIQGENHAITDRSVDVHVVSLRKKLGDSGSLIQTVRGVGYKFKEIKPTE